MVKKQLNPVKLYLIESKGKYEKPESLKTLLSMLKKTSEIFIKKRILELDNLKLTKGAEQEESLFI